MIRKERSLASLSAPTLLISRDARVRSAADFGGAPAPATRGRAVMTSILRSNCTGPRRRSLDRCRCAGAGHPAGGGSRKYPKARSGDPPRTRCRFADAAAVARDRDTAFAGRSACARSGSRRSGGASGSRGGNRPAGQSEGMHGGPRESGQRAASVSRVGRPSSGGGLPAWPYPGRRGCFPESDFRLHNRASRLLDARVAHHLGRSEILPIDLSPGLRRCPAGPQGRPFWRIPPPLCILRARRRRATIAHDFTSPSALAGETRLADSR